MNKGFLWVLRRSFSYRLGFSYRLYLRVAALLGKVRSGQVLPRSLAVPARRPVRLSTRTIGPHSYEHTHKANTRATRGLKAQEREFHTRMAFGMHTRARTRTHPEDTTRREEGADRDARGVAHARWIRASLDRQISQVAALSCVPLEEDARAMLRAACGQQARSWMSAPIRARRVEN